MTSLYILKIIKKNEKNKENNNKTNDEIKLCIRIQKNKNKKYGRRKSFLNNKHLSSYKTIIILFLFRTNFSKLYLLEKLNILFNSVYFVLVSVMITYTLTDIFIVFHVKINLNVTEFLCSI